MIYIYIYIYIFMFNCIWFLSALGVGPVIMVFNHDVFRDFGHASFRIFLPSRSLRNRNSL